MDEQMGTIAKVKEMVDKAENIVVLLGIGTVIESGGENIWSSRECYRIEDKYPVFTVLTREPSEELSRIHDRMPLIMPEDKIDEWISPDSKPEDLRSYALTDMIMEKATD